ncbi:MAG: 50S ribosomal protein L24 [Planctomycetales bacterium]|nr:50S ribosomal protein L24 [Planctomycetales bacterium]NIM07589.1 50S ribosomal protein L24 [Planctomycetales bacterium]NIN07095.1 50S ribosomal protein L24 [Planctomycetales bacterium]NIN76189.1 50S ribosomal protein L24 [Planctomycetales bacterium]NIO33411.1 50S ribosomal protein L24 [Planctomycetales bacterium]
MRIRIDDMVEIISGNDRGTRGKVLKVLPRKGRVLVEGVNRVKKHVRRSQRNPRGGQLSKEMPIDISNVLLVCTACGQPARMGARYLDDGSKERYCKKCGAGNGELAPRRATSARP